MIQHVYQSAAKAKLLDRVIVATDDPTAVEHFRAMPQVQSVSTEGTAITIRGRGTDFVTEIIHGLVEHRIRALDFRTEFPTLEDVFLKLTGRQIRDDA